MARLREMARVLRRRMVAPSLSKTRQLLLGTDVLSLSRQTRQLAAKVDRLTRTLELLMDDPQNQWLYKNRAERMDATVGLFDSRRRVFHLARYQFATRFVAGEVVADIACGTGYGAERLAGEGRAERVIGIDCDPETVDYAREKHMPAGVEFCCASADATGIPDAAIDTVVSFETIEHVASDTALLKEFHRVLCPGGRLIISTPNQWPLENAPHHVRSYNYATFRAVLSTDFHRIEMYTQNSGNECSIGGNEELGIWPTTAQDADAAECYIAVCVKPPG